MNQTVERGEKGSSVGLDSGIEALRRSPAFRGPIEPVGDHEHPNDHFALIYESREAQFATAIPFVRQGLERNERCLCVADDNSRESVLAAMRDRGIDVDEALDWHHQRGEFAGAPCPDVVLLDLNLPATSGHAILDEIKSDSRLQRLPVVVLTRSQTRDDFARAYEGFANACLIKPVDPETFADRLETFAEF